MQDIILVSIIKSQVLYWKLLVSKDMKREIFLKF